MLLEIENQLHKRIHSTLGQSAVVIRLAEDLEKSGQVVENTMVIISWAGADNKNSHPGAYIPTVRQRTLYYTVAVVQKELQREGHSFALPILDLIWDAVTGWVPEVPGLEFQTGFEAGSEKFKSITEASQFIYEMQFGITLNISDGRFFSTPCAAFDDIKLDSFLPQRKCLLTKEKRNTGLAVWRRKTSVDEIEEFVVEDPRCVRHLVDSLKVECSPDFDGLATYEFVDYVGNTTTGQLQRVWKCLRDSKGDFPKWFNLKLNTTLWRNIGDSVPNVLPEYSASQSFSEPLNNAYFKK